MKPSSAAGGAFSIVENPLPKERARGDIHKHPLYYAVRNHIIDFLVERSRSFIAQAGAGYDPRKIALVRPGLPEPAMTPVPGAVQHEVVHRRPGTATVRNVPGSAAHR